VALEELRRARGGLQPPAQAVQHGGLARARLPHDPEHLTRPEAETHVEAADPFAVALGQPAYGQERMVGHRARSRRRSPRSVSEQTKRRPPLSSTMISSRKLSREPQSPQACSHASMVNG